jgi:hypothetical protein
MASTLHSRFLLGKCFAGVHSVKDYIKLTACTRWFQHRQLTTNFPEFQDDPKLQSHDQIYKFSLENPDKFWSTLARSRLQWAKDFDIIKDCDISKGHIQWFLGGQLNASGEF